MSSDNPFDHLRRAQRLTGMRDFSGGYPDLVFVFLDMEWADHANTDLGYRQGDLLEAGVSILDMRNVQNLDLCPTRTFAWADAVMTQVKHRYLRIAELHDVKNIHGNGVGTPVPETWTSRYGPAETVPYDESHATLLDAIVPFRDRRGRPTCDHVLVCHGRSSELAYLTRASILWGQLFDTV